jgi:hypothetical protein
MVASICVNRMASQLGVSRNVLEEEVHWLENNMEGTYSWDLLASV